MVALAHEQAEDHLAEAPLIRQWNLEKAQPYRRRTHGADHRRFNSDRLVFLVRLEHETQERSSIEMSVIRFVERIRLSARNCA
jgi:hypothetical protein